MLKLRICSEIVITQFYESLSFLRVRLSRDLLDNFITLLLDFFEEFPCVFHVTINEATNFLKFLKFKWKYSTELLKYLPHVSLSNFSGFLEAN